WAKLLGWFRPGVRTQEEIADYCSQLLGNLDKTTKLMKLSSEVKILQVAGKGTVAREAEKHCASWIILDRHLSSEGDFCAKSLQCNVVVVDHLVSKFLRLNLKHSQGVHALPFEEAIESSSFSLPALIPAHTANPSTMKDLLFGKTITEFSENEKLSSSLGFDTSIAQDSANSYPASSSDQSMLYVQHKPKFDFRDKSNPTKQGNGLPGWDFAEEKKLTLESIEFEFGDKTNPMEQGNALPSWDFTGEENFRLESSNDAPLQVMNKPVQKIRRRFQKMEPSVETYVNTHKKAPGEISHTKRAMSLCSICQQRAPAFGQPPRKFSYKDLEYATDGFLHTNFLAEGGYGPVYKGILPDGQLVAVKQHKVAIKQQCAPEFCAEVEVLSCAQHKNIVRLIGYCRERGKWLLVYQFACNGSLDNHLYGGVTQLDWKSRQKVAIGVARGLRYLHEECHGGCIIHRDLRPSNILLTHDFEAMVGDFGLARWQPDGQSAEETRIIGTLGYLAPEYTLTGQITEKADVFSFGVILLEIVSGRNAIDICKNRRQQRLSEWARPILEKGITHELIDPRLENRFSEHELQCMMYAASMCIDEDPKARPRISQVLRILEGDHTYEKVCSLISSSRETSLPETHLTSQKTRDVEGRTFSNGNSTSRGQVKHSQNVASDIPVNKPVDYSPHLRTRCGYEGITHNSKRSIPSDRYKDRSAKEILPFCNTEIPSLPSQRHQFGKLEDHTGRDRIFKP
ncbi:hypothetical protein KI387_034911, partial [Taxus chinensis]